MTADDFQYLFLSGLALAVLILGEMVVEMSAHFTNMQRAYDAQTKVYYAMLLEAKKNANHPDGEKVGPGVQEDT